MDQELLDLGQRSYKAELQFIQSSSAYYQAARAMLSKEDVMEKAEACLSDIFLCEEALRELRAHLMAAESTETVSAELERTERNLRSLDKERKAIESLIEEHTNMRTR